VPSSHKKQAHFLANLDQEKDPQRGNLLSEQIEQSFWVKLDAILAREAVIKRLNKKMTASMSL